MDINKIAPPIQFLLNESDEVAAQKKKIKKKEASSLDTENKSEEHISSFLTDETLPELPDLEGIRQKIMNNEYQIDYEKLAQKMLEIEKLWVE